METSLGVVSIYWYPEPLTSFLNSVGSLGVVCIFWYPERTINDTVYVRVWE